MMTKEELQALKDTYKRGMVLELLKEMDDPFNPLEAGIRGICQGVDDAGSILVHWSNGSTLSLIPGADEFKVVVMSDKVKEQILAIRLHPRVPNMFDVNGVQYLANELCYYELVCFIEEHRKEYVHFILTGEAL